jgi:mannose-6-phosphate isomerase-like protein (cupin superfamily)
MLSEVKRADLAGEYETTERCHITEIANDAGDELVSIARARVEAGVTTAWHKLEGITERYIILSGNGRVELDDLAPTEVFAGDVVRIPADKAQRITNTGQDDLVFLAVCAPPFRQDRYIGLE